MHIWHYLKSLLPGIGLGIAGGLVALLTSRLISPPPTFIALDLAGLIAAQVQATAARTDLDDAAKAGRSAVFAKQLEAQANVMAEEYRAIVLVAPAVIAGAPDMTRELSNRVQTVMSSAYGDEGGTP